MEACIGKGFKLYITVYDSNVHLLYVPHKKCSFTWRGETCTLMGSLCVSGTPYQREVHVYEDTVKYGTTTMFIRGMQSV